MTEAEYSRDGSVLVISQSRALYVFAGDGSEPTLLPMPMCNYATVSPNGRWAAASSWRGSESDLRVWELASGKEVLHRTNTQAALAFTPDGHWLVLQTTDFNECLEVGTWKAVSHSAREPGQRKFALSIDARWAALQQGSRQIALCELPAFRPILTLDTDLESPMCLSRNNLLLTRRINGQLKLWDLDLIREQLTALGLGWQN